MTHETPGERVEASFTATESGEPRVVSAIGLKRALAVAEEAAFLWVSRRAVARSSAVTFDVLARMDERLSRLVYKLSERPFLAKRFLRHDPPGFKSGLMFVTAVVALRRSVLEVFEEVLTRHRDPEVLQPLASALTWLDYGEVRRHVERLLAAPSSGLLHLGLVTAVAHRVDPGQALDRALSSEVPALRASALEAVGRLALKGFRPRLNATLGDQDDTCRFWAAWSAVRLGDRDGIPVLGRFAAEGGAFARPACDMALRSLDTDQAVHAQQRLQSTAGHERLAVVAAGIIGDPALAGWLFAAMESPLLARRAGAAFCLMTGCDLRRDDLDAGQLVHAAAPDAVPDGDSDRERVAVQPSPGAGGDAFEDEADDDLAWPDVRRLRKWWDRHGRVFVPGNRYVAGLPVRPAEMTRVLRTGNQRQRAAAALEVALLHPDGPVLDVTAPTHRQLGRSACPS